MSNITSQESSIRQAVLEKLWGYVNDNFHKFTEVNKIKISIALCAKSMPQIIEGNYNVTKMPTVKADTKELEYNLGTRTAITPASSN